MERRDTAPAGHRARESRQAVPQQAARGAGHRWCEVVGSLQQPSMPGV